MASQLRNLTSLGHVFSDAKKTKICPDLTPDWASGERRPIVARPSVIQGDAG